MKTTLVRFNTADDLRLDGLLFEPENKTDKIVVQVHGTGGSFYSNKMVPVIAEQLTKSGYSFLSFNNRGCGMETRFYIEVDDVRVGHKVIGCKHEVFEDCLIDIQAALDFVKQQDYCDIVLSGHSYGCNKVIFYALNNKDFDNKIILLAPCDSGACTWKVKKKEARDTKNIDIFRYTRPANLLLSVIKNDILVQIGTDDGYIVQENKQDCIDKLKIAFESSKLTGYIISNANHNYDGHYSEVAENIVNWLDKK
jgi:alpha-beta hydrolase superfamily lysophospholipase